MLSPSESDAGHSSGDEGLSATFLRIAATPPVAHREDGDLALLDPTDDAVATRVEIAKIVARELGDLPAELRELREPGNRRD